jgi:hypothetical protein
MVAEIRFFMEYCPHACPLTTNSAILLPISVAD